MINFEHQFENPGEQLKKIAVSSFVVSIIAGILMGIASIITGIVFLIDEEMLTGLIFFLCAPIIALLFIGMGKLYSLCLFCYGDSAENLTIVRRTLQGQAKDAPDTSVAIESISTTNATAVTKPQTPAPHTDVVDLRGKTSNPSTVTVRPAAPTTAENNSTTDTNVTQDEEYVLHHALQYATDEGMIDYLRRRKDKYPVILGILSRPTNEIRDAIAEYLNTKN